jgi:hypothetical protein
MNDKLKKRDFRYHFIRTAEGRGLYNVGLLADGCVQFERLSRGDPAAGPPRNSQKNTRGGE